MSQRVGRFADQAPLYAALRAFVALCVAIVLYYTFRSYAFSYFWLDDFNNLYWAQLTSGWAMLWHNVNIASNYFRPVGMLIYWIDLQLFGLNAWAHHLVMWTIHAANVMLVYFLLQRFLKSAYAAAFGALLYTHQSFYWEIFWSSGTVFELMCASFVFTATLLYLRNADDRNVMGMVGATLLYVLAIKSKEMAVVLPAVWLCHAALLSEGRPSIARIGNGLRWRETVVALRPLAAKFVMPVVIGLWFVYLRISTLGAANPSPPVLYGYNVDLSVPTLLQGYGWYWNAVFGTSVPWGWWAALTVAAAAVFIRLGKRLHLFFLLYIPVTLMPVLVLPDHRFAFFWYIPFLGACGLAALLVRGVSDALRRRVPAAVAVGIGAAFFAAASYQHFQIQAGRSAAARQWATEVSDEYRDFVAGLRGLRSPAPGETIFYESTPRFFDPVTILSATQVALERTDVGAEIVTECPLNAGLCVRFENSELSVAGVAAP